MPKPWRSADNYLRSTGAIELRQYRCFALHCLWRNHGTLSVCESDRRKCVTAVLRCSRPANCHRTSMQNRNFYASVENGTWHSWTLTCKFRPWHTDQPDSSIRTISANSRDWVSTGLASYASVVVRPLEILLHWFGHDFWVDMCCVVAQRLADSVRLFRLLWHLISIEPSFSNCIAFASLVVALGHQTFCLVFTFDFPLIYGLTALGKGKHKRIPKQILTMTLVLCVSKS